MESLFKPQSIAVVGASRNREKVGNIVLRNILSTFHGKVYAVNNVTEQIENLKSYKSVTSIADKVDLAVVTVPRQFVLQVMKEAAQKGVASAIVITSGFREVDAFGAKLEVGLMELTREYGIRFLGPNTLGLITPSFNATFAFSDVKKGNIALVAQSGGIGVYMLNWAQMTRTGISHFVSLGNQTDITETEVYEYLVHDPETRAVFSYLEGVADGQHFLDTVPSITVRKPLVFLKGGVGKSGADAVRTHTGSLAGSMQVYEAAVKAVGGILVDDLEDFLDLIKLVSSDELIKPDFLVITNSGGHGVLAADEVERQSGNLINLPQSAREQLSKMLPAQSTARNPLDLSGDSNKDRYNKALEIVQHLDCSKLVIVQSLPMITCTEVAKVLLSYKGKNMIGVMMGMDEDAAARILDSAQIPAFTFPEDAVRSIKRFTSKRAPRRKIRVASPFGQAESLTAGKGYLPDFDALKVCEIYGLQNPKYGLATNVDEAMNVGDEIGYPLVMKVSTDQPVHKTEIGGIRTNIRKEDIAGVFSELSKISKRILMQRQLSGLEVFLGGIKDASFGHTVLVGPGGIYVEILKDVAYGLSPLAEDEAAEMLQESKLHQMLVGRGQRFDEASLIRAITTVSRMIVDLNMSQIDINPLIVNEKGAFAVDVRIILERSASGA